MIKELVTKNRSYRRFYEDHRISYEQLYELVELARLTPSSRNCQSLKFMLYCDAETNAQIYPLLSWAGYLPEWNGAIEGERPSAYIIILGDQRITKTFITDVGIVAQTMMLGAVEKGLGGCMIGTINRREMKTSLIIPDYFEIELVLALGKPKESVVIEDINNDGSVKYWRDEQQVHHVPKRKMEDLIFGA